MKHTIAATQTATDGGEGVRTIDDTRQKKKRNEQASVTRRSTSSTMITKSIISFGQMQLDSETQVLSAPRGSIRLAKNDFLVMQVLMSRNGRLASISAIAEQVWQYPRTEPEFSNVAVRRSIKKLRSFIELAVGPQCAIRCERDCGYQLVEKRPALEDVA